MVRAPKDAIMDHTIFGPDSKTYNIPYPSEWDGITFEGGPLMETVELSSIIAGNDIDDTERLLNLMRAYHEGKLSGACWMTVEQIDEIMNRLSRRILKEYTKMNEERV